MADKQFNARIRWKRDTSANWTSNNPVLLNGEIIIVDTDSGEMRFKIGDGVKTYTQLPFEDEVVRNLININTSAITKLNGDDTTEGSVAKAIADAKSIIDADIDAVEVKADAAQTSVDNLAGTVAYINKENNENIENPDIAASSVIIDSALSRTSANPVQNATITAELDTIKDAKADWNQNDETAIDYIKNRTHYDSRVIKTIEKTFENITETKPVKLADADIDINRIVSYSTSANDGENTYNIIVTDILIDDISDMFNKPTGSVFEIRSNEGRGPIMDYFAVPVEIPDQSNDGSDATVTYHGLYSIVDAGDILVKFEINIESGELKQIDSKFIPSLPPVADWTENDETKAGYIKNRPGGYTALEPAITGKYTGEELNMGEFTLVRDREYIVKIDDMEYKATANHIQTGRYDYALALGTYDFANYPFYILINGNKDILTGSLIAKLKPTITTATITIIDDVIHQFDIKYIPDIPAEKIYPSPTNGFTFIDTVTLARGMSQTLYLSGYKYGKYRIIIGYGIVRTETSPSRVKIEHCKEPEEGGELRYNTYKYIRFIGHRRIDPANPDNKDFFISVSRLWDYEGHGESDYEYYNQDMHFNKSSGLSFTSLNGSNLEATTFYIYGMN